MKEHVMKNQIAKIYAFVQEEEACLVVHLIRVNKNHCIVLKWNEEAKNVRLHSPQGEMEPICKRHQSSMRQSQMVNSNYRSSQKIMFINKVVINKMSSNL